MCLAHSNQESNSTQNSNQDPCCSKRQHHTFLWASLAAIVLGTLAALWALNFKSSQLNETPELTSDTTNTPTEETVTTPAETGTIDEELSTGDSLLSDLNATELSDDQLSDSALDL
ncbi:hypothetical protein HYW32_01295 [Candidatus Berkelbacteria bacterium]|nr:hypothetical protein [Candidatus Berkelbacteria bacterium]